MGTETQFLKTRSFKCKYLRFLIPAEFQALFSLALCLVKVITKEAEGCLTLLERALPVCLRSCSGDKHRTLASGWMSLRGYMN